MDPVAFVRQRGGAARFVEIPASRYALARLVEAGELVRPARGCYALPGLTHPVVDAVRLDAVVSCVSALRVHGVPVPGDASVVHCSIPRSRGSSRRVPAGVVRHSEDVRAVPGHVRLTDVEDAAARAMRCLPYGSALAVLDQVGRQHGRDVVDRALARLSRTRRALAADLAIDVDCRSRSHTESVLRWALRSAGHAVAAGVVLPGVGEVDLLVDGVVVVELDGFAYHSGRQQYRADRRRDRQALRLGHVTLRFAYEDSDPREAVPAVTGQVEALAGHPLPFAADVSEPVRALVADIRAEATGPGARAVGRAWDPNAPV